MEVKEITLLEELCGKCDGCSTRPISIERLCFNPLEKYLYRMNPTMGTEGEAYFRGRKDGLMMLEANKEQILKAGIKEVVDWIEKTYGWYCDGLEKIIIEDGGYYGKRGDVARWQSKKKEWGIDE